MIRIILQRHFSCAGHEQKDIQSFDIEHSQIEKFLKEQGSGENWVDSRQCVGIEVLNKTTEQ